MLKRVLMATAISLAAVSAQAQVLVSENFDNFSGLGAAGWIQTNNSTPGGSTNWFEGNADIFGAQAGAPNSYIAANFNNAPVGGTIDNWLISPSFSTASSVQVTFWAKAAIDEGFADTISVGFGNAAGAINSFALGTLTTVSGAWAMYTATLYGQGAGTFGRFAINYSGAADYSNYVGIDTVTVTAVVPEPSTYLLMAAGLLGLAMFNRRRAAAKR